MQLRAATLAAAAIFAAQEEPEPRPPPPPILPPPAPIDVDRTGAPVEFDLNFQLGEEEPSALLVSFASRGDPGAGDPATACELSLAFDPFEGARWEWRAAPGRPAVLTQIPEPKGLRYVLTVKLLAGRGVEITLADGAPVLVATTPDFPTLRVTLTTSGALLGLNASTLRIGGDATVRTILEAAKIDVRRQPPARAAAAGFGVHELVAGEAPPLVATRAADVRSAPEGSIERLLLEPSEDVDVPVLVITPADRGDATRAATKTVLLIAGAGDGKAGSEALARIAALSKAGARVVAIDALGAGERRELQPRDRLVDRELDLVGSSAPAVQATELRQIRAWIEQRADFGGVPIEVVLSSELAAELARAGAIGPRLREVPADPAAAPSGELRDAATLGDEWGRPHYESFLLAKAFELRESLPLPDRDLPIVERIGLAATEAIDDCVATAWVWQPGGSLGQSGIRAFADLPPGPLLLAASDESPLQLLHDLASESREPTLVVFADDRSPAGVPAPEAIVAIDAARTLAGIVAPLQAAIRAAAHPTKGPARRIRLFGEGFFGIAMLLAAVREPELVESVTARHAIPSFELLLRRPQDAARAPPAAGVLTQGLDEMLFLPSVLARFEIEECVLELRRHSVAVEWRDPVDALRRPLSRHDRIAMWPRLRHLTSQGEHGR